MSRRHLLLGSVCRALPIALFLAGCSGANAVSPASHVPRGSASITVAGMFSGLQHDSIVASDVIARTWRQDPVSTSSQGTAGLVLTWPGTPGWAAEPMNFWMPIPYAYGSFPHTIVLPANQYNAVLNATRVNGGQVSYTASGGRVTINSMTDSTVTGTLDIVFRIGPPGSNVRMTGEFNATRCNTQIDVYTNPCSPTQTY